MTSPRISVVVAFFNNAGDLADCLDSIAAQSYPDLEVIMVDDGSTDHSAAIARAKAAADPRFRLVQPPEHGGPGGARNRGIEHARGEYLAFVDGDDMLPANAYELLLHTLERSGSDFVSGAVWRVSPAGASLSGLHALAIKGRQTGTHVTRTPRLLYDISVWNKLFRRSFWDQHQLSFPEGVVWEDLRLMTKAHVLAKAVDVIPDVIYYWRARTQGVLSITQSRTSITNLRDRMTALDDIDSFIAAHSTARLLRAHQRKALKNDLWLYVQDLHKVTEAYRAEFTERVNGYLDDVGRRVLRSLPATHKLAYYLVRIRATPQLAGLAAWLVEQPVRQVPIVRHRGRLRADLPFRTGSAVRVPGRVFRPHWRDLDPIVWVDDIGWEQDRLVVTGRANVPSVDIPRRRNVTKIVVLRPPGRRLPIVRPARSFLNPQATALSEQDRYNYDWSGFRFTVSPRWFRGTGEWQCYMLVRGHGVWRPARVHSPVPGPAERPRPRQVAPGLRFGARWAGLGLNVATWRLGAVVTAVGWPEPRAAEIEIETTNGAAVTGPSSATPADGGAPVPAELVLVRSRGAATRSFPAVPQPAPGRFLARVPLGELAGATDAVDRATGLGPLADDEMAWDAYLKVPGRPRVRVAWPEELPETRQLSGDWEAVAGQSRYGDLVIAERTPRPVIDEHEWRPGGRLVLRGSFLGAGLPGAESGDRYETVLRRAGSADSHVIGFEVRDERFTIEADLDRMPFFGSAVPLRDDQWHLYVRPAGTGAEALAELRYDHDRLGDVTGQRVAGGRKWYRLLVTGYDTPLITAEPQRRRVEQGNFGARALRRGFYPALLRSAPLRDQVFFVSWKGKQCGDNPLGVAEELRRRGDDREHLWAVTDYSVPVPEGGTAVLRGTQEYYEALARSKYVISNDDMQAPFRKRDGQTYLQTWHGTPLKKIGFDIANPQFISGTAYFDHLARDVAQWDLLLSPNPFSTPIMRGAFRYEGEICEYGYPRNDLLSRPDAAEVAARVRDRLGLPAGKRVVLYAPTWRDNQVYANGRRYRFDMRLDLERAWSGLGDDYVFLIRGHHHMADDVPAGMRPGFAVNVTAYPDITELYLVSDILVTDYSSTMFDYAVTGRPMLFFTYDLADYRDNLRGFYFDFEAEAPGPLLATSDEVIAAVRDTGAVAASYRDAYERFAARFACLDDGKAGARVCDRLFSGRLPGVACLPRSVRSSMSGSPRAQKLREHEQRPPGPLRLDSVMSEGVRRPGAGAREGMAVAETDLGLEDLAAAVAAEPRGPVTPSAPGQPERAGPLAAARGRRRWTRWLVVAVPMAVAAVTGGYQIGSASLWRDEAYTKDAIGRSAGQLFALLGHQDAVHGAYYLLMHAVAGVIGTSATALRLPSLGAMVIAAGFTAATARRAASLTWPPSPLPGRTGTARWLDVPALTGLLAGLLFATAPYMTYYAQMARPYALETMFATIATYLLIRAWPDGRWRWWLGYGTAVALTGLLNIFGLLILAAHGVTLLLTPARGQLATGQAAAGQAAAGRRIGRFPWRWLAVSAAAVAVLFPLLAVARHQQQQIAWLPRPTFGAIGRLLSTTAGSRDLVLPLALLALGGLAAAWLADGWRPLNPAAVALPWLVMPPFLLIAASFVKPVYYVRYVEFCLPALAIAAGAGLTGLAGRTPLARLRPAGSRWAWAGPLLPAALVLAVLAALLAGPQQAIRQTAARPDDLRKASAIVAAREQPGDVVFYIPFVMRVLGTGYPAPFLRLRDIALGRSAIASATLTGTEITSPAELKSRFTDVRRVWVVTGAKDYKFPVPSTRMDKEKLALLAGAGLHVIGRWQAGEVKLTLYGR